MILTLAVSGYRSLRDLVLPLEPLSVFTGANGSGKSSLYRAIGLLAAASQGRVVSALAGEGGLQSTLWAGPESFSKAMKRGEAPVQGTVRTGPVSLRLGYVEEDYGYAIDLGLPIDRGVFGQDPEIKAEAVWAGPVLRRANTLALRRRGAAWSSGAGTEEDLLRRDLNAFDSMLSQAASPRETPELVELRDRMRQWRFYDHLRTDRDAPARQPQIGTRTPVLANDGGDLAAAIATIQEVGDAAALAETIEDAFPGSVLELQTNGAYFEILLRQPGLLRPLRSAEWSDGTLRYVLLAAALLTPRPPPLMVLNEPETSLHPSLLAPLARLVARASQRSQILLVSHAAPLVSALAECGAAVFALKKELGETVVEGVERPRWEWPSR